MDIYIAAREREGREKVCARGAMKIICVYWTVCDGRLFTHLARI